MAGLYATLCSSAFYSPPSLSVRLTLQMCFLGTEALDEERGVSERTLTCHSGLSPQDMFPVDPEVPTHLPQLL